jgi:transcriptional regulator with XRE-family HTH domain
VELLLDQMQGQDPKAIGLRVELRREMLGLEKEEVAEALGMGIQTFQRLTRGARTFDSETLSRLCQVLDCSIHYIMDIPDGLGNGAIEYLVLMYWRTLPQAQEVPWIREGLLETLRKTVLGNVLEKKAASRSRSESSDEEAEKG